MADITIKTIILGLGDGDWPMIEHLEFDGEQAILQINIPTNLDVFKGHFPDQAVLPGIVQIHWAAEIGKLIFAARQTPSSVSNFTALRGIKFNGMVLPGQKLNLVLSYDSISNRLKFEFSDSQQKYSNGIIESAGAQ